MAVLEARTQQAPSRPPLPASTWSLPDAHYGMAWRPTQKLRVCTGAAYIHALHSIRNLKPLKEGTSNVRSSREGRGRLQGGGRVGA